MQTLNPLYESLFSLFRFVLTPYGDMPDGVLVAAVAWEYAIAMDCVDVESLRVFVAARHAKGPEDVAADGGFGERRRGDCALSRWALNPKP